MFADRRTQTKPLAVLRAEVAARPRARSSWSTGDCRSNAAAQKWFFSPRLAGEAALYLHDRLSVDLTRRVQCRDVE